MFSIETIIMINSTYYTQKPVIFVGDIHGNAAALTQIINVYPESYYHVIWSGDFINSKKPVTDKEIEYVLHIILNNCKHVLYSNHMHLLFRHLTGATVPCETENVKHTWSQTIRVLEAQPESMRKALKIHCLNSYLSLSVNNILFSHAYPNEQTINKKFSGILTHDYRKTVGIGPESNTLLKILYERSHFDFKHHKLAVVGHHGIVARHDNIRIVDLKGLQVPVWESETDLIKIF